MIAETWYGDKTTYQVKELIRRSCHGCCFEEAKRNVYCSHANTFNCNHNESICVHDLEKYRVAFVTKTLTGEP